MAHTWIINMQRSCVELFMSICGHAFQVDHISSLYPIVTGLSAGDSVAVMSYGCFSEFVTVPATMAIPIPAPLPQIVALLTSGLTASIGEINRRNPVKFLDSPSIGSVACFYCAEIFRCKLYVLASDAIS